MVHTFLGKKWVLAPALQQLPQTALSRVITQTEHESEFQLWEKSLKAWKMLHGGFVSLQYSYERIHCLAVPFSSHVRTLHVFYSHGSMKCSPIVVWPTHSLWILYTIHLLHSIAYKAVDAGLDWKCCLTDFHRDRPDSLLSIALQSFYKIQI